MTTWELLPAVPRSRHADVFLFERAARARVRWDDVVTWARAAGHEVTPEDHPTARRCIRLRDDDQRARALVAEWRLAGCPGVRRTP